MSTYEYLGYEFGRAELLHKLYAADQLDSFGTDDYSAPLRPH